MIVLVAWIIGALPSLIKDLELVRESHQLYKKWTQIFGTPHCLFEAKRYSIV